MEEEYDHIQFRQGLPFYDMVMSFMTSLSTFSFILNNKKLIELKEKDYVSIEGKWVAPMHFFPHDVVSNIQSGKYSRVGWATALSLPNIPMHRSQP